MAAEKAPRKFLGDKTISRTFYSRLVRGQGEEGSHISQTNTVKGKKDI